jgi:hypothetical protein
MYVFILAAAIVSVAIAAVLPIEVGHNLDQHTPSL